MAEPPPLSACVVIDINIERGHAVVLTRHARFVHVTLDQLPDGAKVGDLVPYPEVEPVSTGPHEGHHALHFHVDDGHFRIIARSFLLQADRARAAVQYDLPQDLGAIVEAEAAEMDLQYPLTAITYAPDADHVRRHTLDSLRFARRRGASQLWLLLWCKEVFAVPEVWEEAEQIWTELAADFPISVLCSFRLQEYPTERVDAMMAHHPHHYVGGEFMRAGTAG